ncbi:MAG: hypothetical protein CXT70_00540 [Methanobacteriota archaeon]|nr:MAG: hypothetical protein CXT70_00540 [Euryarchaeota archaeon]
MSEEGEGEKATPPRHSNQNDLLRKKNFDRAKGLDVSSFMVSNDEPEAPSQAEVIPQPKEDVEQDIAVGQMTEIFSRGDAPSNQPGAIQRDGTVSSPNELDTVTDIAVHGEKQLSKGMMVAMIVIWTMIGALIGTNPEIPPLLSLFGLVSMAIFGLFCGENWIPKNHMRLLGVTWVIISMKLLYGLMLDIWHWGWFDSSPIGSSQTLGIALLTLVGFNIAIAQRHNEDAIAAQATIVLMVVGSATGAIYGEVGIAAMIGLGTLIFHGLAILRNSGNLASLGIAVSYLWIGVHAISSGWNLFGLEILSFDDDLLLFLLMAGVTGTNAAMAAHFVKADNWFSDGLNALGLGKPGLWAVSVSLGMFGALLAIAAHRLETGYAIAQLVLLITAFTASYLVVRGVEWSQIVPYVILPAPLLLGMLVLLTSDTFSIELPWGLQSYTLYAVFTSILTSTVLLRNQTVVSDHVLWMGGLAIIILLTLLIPANDSGTGARTLLISQGFVWGGLAFLALRRDSPSIAGVAVLAPWAWLLIFATNAESRLISSDFIPISIEQWDLAIWLGVLVIQQVSVNVKQGGVGINLAARLLGLSEIGARMRDSGLLKLWNMSFIISVFTVWAIARPGALPAFGMLWTLGALLISHSYMVLIGKHDGKPRTLMTIWGVFAIILSYSFGFGGIFATFLVIASLLLLLHGDNMRKDEVHLAEIEAAEALPGQLLSLMMGLLAGLFIVIALKPLNQQDLSGIEMLPDATSNLLILVFVSYVGLVLYLRRAAKVEKMLPPAIAAISLIVMMGLAGRAEGVAIVDILTLVAFMGSGAYLAFQGEVRSGLQALARKEDRIAEIERKQQLMQELLQTSEQTQADSSSNNQLDNKSNLRMIDTQMLELIEKQRKRSKRSGSIGKYDLEIGDIHHRPTVVMTFLAVTILVSTWFSFTTAGGFLALGFSVAVSILFITLSRLRANQIGLRLPDIMGIELPVAISMVGLVLVHIAGRVSQSVVTLEETYHLLLLFSGLAVLAGVGLMGRNDLGIRIPNALEGVIYLFALDRILALLVGGEVPIPLQTDPFAYSQFMSWTLPLLVMEVLILIAVLLFDWVEAQRLSRQLPDHRGAAGRSAWVMMASLLSFGPAGIIAAVLTIRRGVNWTQPAAVLTAWLVAPLMVFATLFWLPDLLSISTQFVLSEIVLTFGIISVIFSAWTVISRKGLWLTSGLWASHMLILPAVFAMSNLLFVIIAAFALSATAWVSGILTLRKGWRIIGASDLLLGLLFGGIFFISGAGIGAILIVLFGSAVLLGTITYLTQTYEGHLSED